MNGSLRVARILGIPIEIHYTWLLVFALIAWSLAVGYFPQVGPELGSRIRTVLAVSAAVLFFVTLLLHELAHAYVARREGLPVRSITLFIFGGVAQMTREPRSAGTEFRMAIAGPLTSLGFAALFALLARLIAGLGSSRPLVLLFQYLGFINAAVAVFNLLPAFPLDGGRVFRSAIWHVTGSLSRATRIASRVGQGFAYALIALGLLRVITGRTPAGLWMAFIGWFLLQAAQAGYQQVLIRRALRGVQAQDLMRHQVEAVPADLPLSDFVHDHLLRSRASEFCVVEDGQFEGLISLPEVKRVPRERWSEVRVAEVMTREADCPWVDADDSASDVLMLLSREGSSQVAVRQNAHFVGVVTREDLLAYIRMRLELEGA